MKYQVFNPQQHSVEVKVYEDPTRNPIFPPRGRMTLEIPEEFKLYYVQAGLILQPQK